MSEEKVFEVAGVETIEKPLEDGGSIKYPKPKEKKKRKEMTDEQREAMKLRLAKGRETALKNRQKKALLRKIDNEEAEKAKDEKIAKHVLKKDSKEEQINNLKMDIEQLKTKPSTPSNDAKLQKLQDNMILMGQVVDHLVKENNEYKKRKETKKKQREDEVNKKKQVEDQKVQEQKVQAKKVYDTSKHRKNILGGML